MEFGVRVVSEDVREGPGDEDTVHGILPSRRFCRSRRDGTPTLDRDGRRRGRPEDEDGTLRVRPCLKGVLSFPLFHLYLWSSRIKRRVL